MNQMTVLRRIICLKSVANLSLTKQSSVLSENFSVSSSTSSKHFSTTKAVRKPTSFTTDDNFNGFVKGPTIEVVASVIMRGLSNVHLVPPKTAPIPSLLPFLYGVTPQVFIEGALVAIEVAGNAIRLCINPETREEGLQELQGIVTPPVYNKISTLLRDQQDIKLSNLEIPTKDDVVFSWVSSTKVNADRGECIINVCIASIKGYESIRKDYLVRKEAEKIFSEELKAFVKSGASKEEFTEKVKGFEAQYPDNLSFIKDRPLNISNFRLSLKAEEGDWKIDLISIRDSQEVWNIASLFRWKSRIFLSIRTNNPFISILRIDYGTDLIALILLTVVVLLNMNL